METSYYAGEGRAVRSIAGFEWFEKFCADHGCRIIVMNVESLSLEAEMSNDLLSIIHCFSSRLYGLRKYKKRLHDMIVEKER